MSSIAQQQNHHLARLAEEYPGKKVALAIHGECKGDGGPVIEQQGSRIQVQLSSGRICHLSENDVLSRSPPYERKFDRERREYQERQARYANLNRGNRSEKLAAVVISRTHPQAKTRDQLRRVVEKYGLDRGYSGTSRSYRFGQGHGGDIPSGLQRIVKVSPYVSLIYVPNTHKDNLMATSRRSSSPRYKGEVFDYTVIFLSDQGRAISREHFYARDMDAAVKRAISRISYQMKHDNLIAGGYVQRNRVESGYR